MGQWDSGAAERLDAVVADLRERGVVDVVHDLADRVWRANLQRYEPRELGDTTRWLGMSAAGDLTQLVGRHYAGAEVRESAGVAASWPDGALVLSTGGVRVQLMKAPASSLRTPAWGSFTWSVADSRSRLLAARRNTLRYAPADSDQDGRAPMLTPAGDHLDYLGQHGGAGDSPGDGAGAGAGAGGGQDPLWAPGGDPARLAEVMLVWSGEPEQAVTAGWLGLPALGSPPWFAVAPLWWDETPAAQAAPREPDREEQTGDAFSDRSQPQLALGLKRPPAAPATSATPAQPAGSPGRGRP